jgi:hypothetical protein
MKRKPNKVSLALVKNQPDEHLVQSAEKFLDMVKSGDVVSFAASIEMRGEGSGTQFSLTKGSSIPKLIGLVRYLESRLIKAYDDCD